MTELALRQIAGLRRLGEPMLSVWGLLLLIPLLAAMADPARIGEILVHAAASFAGTLPYIALAVLLIAYLKASGAEAIIARAFEGRETRMILLAGLFGGLAPFCSCEVIPFVSGLLALGVPVSAVMAFWLSSPLIDPPNLFITAAALGWQFAIAKAVAAIGIGIAGGFAMRALTATGGFSDVLRPAARGCCSSCGVDPLKGRPVWRFWHAPQRRAAFASAARENGLFLFKWLSLAYLLQALLVAYVPADVIGAAVGGEGLLSVLTGALVGAPAYLNSYAAPPLVAGLMQQGMSAGAAMAFMVAGAVSCIPAMAAVWSLVKGRVFAAYVGFGLGGAILAGLIYGLVA